jgi:hypothetical protein
MTMDAIINRHGKPGILLKRPNKKGEYKTLLRCAVC